MQLRFAIHTLGCKVNTYESDAMAERLRASGFVECSFEEAADIYIINTCTVTNIADRKSRQMLRRARKMNPEAFVVAAGCYVDDAIKNEKLEELISDGIIDAAVPNRDKNRIAELVTKIAEKRKAIPAACGTGNASAAADVSCAEGVSSADAGKGEFLTELDGHTRAFIKVQDGCNMYCSYCIIPYVRGPLRARPVGDVLREISLLAEGGTAEAVITGIHLSSLKNGILDILEGIEKIDGIRRVRLGSLEPTLITRDFVSGLKSFPKLCPHFHLSLQSGNDDILRRMNRHYTTEEYEKSCGLLREFFEHPAITTDIIVGFPGETEKQFRDTADFARRIGFYEAHVFKYSRRSGTPADRMDGQLTEAEKSRRSEELIRITDELSGDFRRYYLGRELEFLSEEAVTIDGIIYETGFTPEYVRCLKASGKLHQNEIIRGKGSHIVQENVVDESIVLV